MASESVPIEQRVWRCLILGHRPHPVYRYKVRSPANLRDVLMTYCVRCRKDLAA